MVVNHYFLNKNIDDGKSRIRESKNYKKNLYNQIVPVTMVGIIRKIRD